MWSSIKYYYSNLSRVCHEQYQLIFLGRPLENPEPWCIQANVQVYTLLLDAFNQENMEITQRAKMDNQVLFSIIGTEAQIKRIQESIPLTSYVRDKVVSIAGV